MGWREGLGVGMERFSALAGPGGGGVCFWNVVFAKGAWLRYPFPRSFNSLSGKTAR